MLDEIIKALTSIWLVVQISTKLYDTFKRK